MRRRDMTNPALIGAYYKGWLAGQSALRCSCPYMDHRKADGRLTFSRAFRRAWFQGNDDAARGKRPRHKPEWAKRL